MFCLFQYEDEKKEIYTYRFISKLLNVIIIFATKWMHASVLRTELPCDIMGLSCILAYLMMWTNKIFSGKRNQLPIEIIHT